MHKRVFWSGLIIIVALVVMLSAGKVYFSHKCGCGAWDMGRGSAMHGGGAGAGPSTPLDTSSWKTYENDNFGFTIQYPASWQVSENSVHANPPVVLFGDPLTGTTTYMMQVSIIENTSTISSASYVAQMLETDRAEDAANAKNGPAPTVTPTFDAQYPIKAPNYTAWELYNVFEFDHNAERIYVEHGNEILLFDFPVADANPNLSTPTANNMIANAMFQTLTLTTSTGAFCGGIAGFQCSAGYTCKLGASYPDAGGHCVL